MQGLTRPAADAAVPGITRQFLLWVSARPRTYNEAMEAWRTSCPRLSAWEDALCDGLVQVEASGAASYAASPVRLTARGVAALGAGR